MGRTWECHQLDVACDVCGKVQPFVWDIYGDLICPDCMRKEVPVEDETDDEV